LKLYYAIPLGWHSFKTANLSREMRSIFNESGRFFLKMSIREKIECSTIKTKFNLHKEVLFYKCYNEDVMVFVQRLKFVLFFVCSSFNLTAQTISGNLSLLPNQPIKLEGFNGLKTYPISSTTIDEKGNFKLNYFQSDYGVGYLMSADNKPLFVILSGEDIEIVGEALSYTETIFR